MLEKITALVAEDLSSVETLGYTKFAPEVSNTLTKYMTALQGVAKHFREKDETEQSALSKLSTKDLRARTEEMLKELTG